MRVNKGGCPLPAPPLRIVWLIERGQVGAFFCGETEKGGCCAARRTACLIARLTAPLQENGGILGFYTCNYFMVSVHLGAHGLG